MVKFSQECPNFLLKLDDMTSSTEYEEGIFEVTFQGKVIFNYKAVALMS